MRLLTREALTAAIRKAKADKTVIELGDDVVRSVRTDRLRAEATDEDKAKVKEQLGDDAAAGRIVPFTISTERRASDGHVIKAAGWQLDRFRKNPVVLHGHSRWSPRIADSVVEVVDTRLRGIASFFPRDLSPLSWELGEIAATRGHAASVGFRILRATPAPDDVTENIPWALDIDAARLDEWSLVTIGADEDALVEGRTAGLSTEAIGEALARILDERQLTPALRAEVERLHRIASPSTVVRMAGSGGVAGTPIGPRVRIKKGAMHEGMSEEMEGVVVELGGPALGIRFDEMDGVHRWYTADELEAIDDDNGDDDAAADDDVAHADPEHAARLQAIAASQARARQLLQG